MQPSPEISVAKAGSRTILAPQDSLTYESCKELEVAMNECISQQQTNIILDCKAVQFMDSEALELLVRMHEELRKLGGTLRITDLNEVCSDIFQATRLIHLNVYADIHEAIKSGP